MVLLYSVEGDDVSNSPSKLTFNEIYFCVCVSWCVRISPDPNTKWKRFVWECLPINLQYFCHSDNDCKVSINLNEVCKNGESFRLEDSQRTDLEERDGGWRKNFPTYVQRTKCSNSTSSWRYVFMPYKFPNCKRKVGWPILCLRSSSIMVCRGCSLSDFKNVVSSNE